jgi:CHAT domain-containing protein
MYSLGPRSFVAVVPAPGDSVSIHELRWPEGGVVDEDSLGRVARSYREDLLWRRSTSDSSRKGLVPLDVPRSVLDSRLWRTLMPEVIWDEIRRLDHVFVVAQGGLNDLPFEGLVVSDDRGDGPRYWLDEGPGVSYVPSGSVLRWLRQRRGEEVRAEKGLEAVLLGDPDFLGLGDSRSGGASPLAGSEQGTKSGEAFRSALDPGSLERLEWTRAEVESVGAVLGGEPRVKKLLGPSARRDSLEYWASQARYVHVATHGLTDRNDPWLFSRLALSVPPESVRGVSPYLSLQDLLEGWRERLEGSELVVLSACETAQGRVERDEGVMALPVGFLYAGAPAVVATQWPISDQRTAELMGDFYGRLAEGGDKLAALREAVREHRRKYPEPYYWAPFVYIGVPE